MMNSYPCRQCNMDDGSPMCLRDERCPGRGAGRTLTIAGDENTPPMPMTDAQVGHLRRLLAWMRCEWTLDEDMQRGYLQGAAAAVQYAHATPEQAGAIVAEKAAQINRCPAYVRQAVKMLTKALRDHERNAGIVDSSEADRAK